MGVRGQTAPAETSQTKKSAIPASSYNFSENRTSLADLSVLWTQLIEAVAASAVHAQLSPGRKSDFIEKKHSDHRLRP